MRLDRAIADNAWRDTFPNATLAHLASPRSDHCPISLQLSQEMKQPARKKILHYEIFWEREPSLPEVVQESWVEAGTKSDLGDISAALCKVMASLHSWSKVKFKNIGRELQKARKKLAELLETYADSAAVRQASDHMNELLYREEMLWLQRSRINWLKEGYRNTRFFHSKAIWRAKKNRIQSLKDSAGTVHRSATAMEQLATEYFQEVYYADPSLDHSIVPSLFQSKVSAQMNEALCSDLTEEEISTAIFQIGPLKAPGPDGFPARFYQRNWGTIKSEVVKAVHNFFIIGVMPEGINDTAIVLIPKIKQPTQLKDYRPISLCNVIYKVVSKCLVNRLRPFLDELVSPNQSAFVPERLITDNALVAFECFHFIQKNKNPNKAACAYKLDLSKAYNRVDWRFLEQAMHKMGFAHRWVSWIMSCVTTVRYSVKFNGTLLSAFAPTRGLRQGDPLSPFLFLFVADGLSLLLEEKVRQGAILPLHVCRRAPGISHLLFADDTLLFFEAVKEQTVAIKQVLNDFAASTGQLINPSNAQSCLVRLPLQQSNRISDRFCKLVIMVSMTDTWGFRHRRVE